MTKEIRSRLPRPVNIHKNVPSGFPRDIQASAAEFGFFERDSSTSLKYSNLCDICHLPILIRHQSSHANGQTVNHIMCEFGRVPVRIEDSREALAKRCRPT